MPGDVYRRIQRGSRRPLSAAATNKLLDLLQGFSGQEIGQLGGMPDDRNPGEIRVRNDTGADVAQFAILALTDPIVDPADYAESFLQEPGFNGVAADSTSIRVAVMQEGVPNMTPPGVGKAVVSGLTIAYVDLPDGSIYTLCRPLDDDKFEAITADDAAEGELLIPLWWHETGPGTVRGVVLLPGSQLSSGDTSAAGGPCDCPAAGIDAQWLNVTYNGSAYMLYYAIGDTVLTYVGGGVWESTDFSVVCGSYDIRTCKYRMTVTSNSIDGVLVELIETSPGSGTIQNWINSVAAFITHVGVAVYPKDYVVGACPELVRDCRLCVRPYVLYGCECDGHPYIMKVTISGITSTTQPGCGGGGGCAETGTLMNGTYYCQYNAYLSSFWDGCVWRWDNFNQPPPLDTEQGFDHYVEVRIGASGANKMVVITEQFDSHLTPSGCRNTCVSNVVWEQIVNHLTWCASIPDGGFTPPVQTVFGSPNENVNGTPAVVVLPIRL